MGKGDLTRPPSCSPKLKESAEVSGIGQERLE